MSIHIYMYVYIYIYIYVHMYTHIVITSYSYTYTYIHTMKIACTYDRLAQLQKPHDLNGRFTYRSPTSLRVRLDQDL